MKNSLKKTISIMLTVVLLLTAAPLSGFVGLKINLDWLDFSTKSSALDATGQCGYNVYWTFDESTGTLTISGTGYMYDYLLGEEIDESPFYKDSNIIRTVVIESGVTSIGDNAFACCTGLTSVIIPDSVTSIDYYAFSGCTGLTSITIPDSVTSIGEYAFSYCTGLTTVNYNAFNCIIDPYSKPFKGCTNLSEVNIGENVTAFSISVFSGCTGLTTVNYNAVNCTSNYLFSGCTTLSEVNIGENVIAIPDYAFYNCTGLTSVTIPDSVTSIGSSAFSGCTGLTSVTIPDSVTSIGNGAFSGCTGLTTVNYNAVNCTAYPNQYNNPFEGCYNLSEVNIGENVTALPDYAFYNCTGLTSITIPNSVTSIGSSAFRSCTGLTSITIPDSVTTIGESAFYRCTGLMNITIPDNVTSIGDYSFKACTGLTNVIFKSDDYIDIGIGAFDECYNIVICCKENSYMHYYAERKGLQFCILDDNDDPSFTVENDILVSYNGSTENVFISSASKIGFGAFAGNSTLRSVELAANVTRIYNQAFRNCANLESIIIPRNVSSIGNAAFEGCGNLTIRCYAGSYAEAFAVNHDIPYELIKLNLSDASIVLSENETATLTATFSADLVEPDSIIWTSSDPDVADVVNGAVSVHDCGETEITATTASGLSAVCTLKVDMKLKDAADAGIDYDSGIVYGADLVGKSETAVKDLFANGNITVTSSGGRTGTGDTVTLYKSNGDVYRQITVVVFGDVNGDGIYDGQDAFIVNCIANGMLTKEQVGETKWMAADCNHDGEVNSIDVAILEQAGLLLSQVDQTKEDYAETDAYAEYIDLIDQNPEPDELVSEEPTAQESRPQTLIDKIIEIIKYIISIIRSVFKF